MRVIQGPMINPDGSPMADVTLVLYAKRINWSADGLSPASIEQRLVTDSAGNFVLTLAQGDYEAWYVMPDSNNAMERLGPLLVEDGDPIELGELLELSRDASADLSISADWATKDWVTAQITIGAVPYAVAINALNPGTGTAGQFYKVTANGLNLEPFTFQLKDWVIGEGEVGGRLYRKADGKLGVLPAPRAVNDDTVAVLGDTITILMDDATGDIDLTLPAMSDYSEPHIKLIIKCSTYLLPHAINLRRDADQTIEGIDDDWVITRRRPVELYPSDTNDWSFV